MASIKILKDKFDTLPFSEATIELYEALLYLDISDFKPIMEEILAGRIDIEDTRKLFSTNINYAWSNQFNGYVSDTTEKLNDPRISSDIGQTIKDNLVSRFFGNESEIIKESLAFPNQDDLRTKIADEFFRRTGNKLPKEDIERILPIVKSELFVELSLDNPNAVKSKDYQLVLADLLSFKPTAEI